ncbi:MAG TPA: MBL fold metallo-hydrolase [Anaerolineales bacterium]|nr:MBL fold metallo-hydrolase [Anaerolineae bacterium]HIQ01854.1 MBL fold metallo-hydrolase [Anaerolineales bacterium]
MARVILLGTAAAVPTPENGTTSLAVEGEGGFLLVDCGESPMPRLARAGLSFDRLQGLILTHFHPDHVAGVPLLIVDLWLLGRKQPLPVFGLPDTLDRLLAMMDLFQWERWEELYPVVPVPISPQGGAEGVEVAGLRVTAAPVVHLVPTLGFRFEDRRTGRAMAYSADTAPCPALVDLARGADLLLHEATGVFLGHSSPAQAGEVARQAGVDRLVLVHYPPDPALSDRWLEEARAAFGGPTELGRDFHELFF